MKREKEYSSPKIEVIVFEEQDLICTSGERTENDFYDDWAEDNFLG